MLMPPLVVRVRLARRGRGGKTLGLWLPVVLLWPVIGALAVAAFAVAVPLSAALRASGHARAVLWSVPYLLRLLAAARGFELVLTDGDRELTVRFS